MSRIGKLPVEIPAGVEVKLDGGRILTSGKLGRLELQLVGGVGVEVNGDRVTVAPGNDDKRSVSMWATTRTLINNMVVGVSTGFAKNLEITGTGYRAAVQGSDLVLQLGYSHEIRYPVPEGIEITCERPTAIKVSGFDKQQVGQVAAELRAFRGPEPFKGKGIRYANERILRKEGKKK